MKNVLNLNILKIYITYIRVTIILFAVAILREIHRRKVIC